MNQGRTKLLLAGLGVVVLFAVWQWIGPALGMGGDSERIGGGGDDAGEFRPMGRAGNLGRTSARRQVDEVVDLRIAELGGTARDYKPGRDPWRFVIPPPPKPPPPPPPPPPPSKEEIERRLQAQRLLDAQRAAEAAKAAEPKPPQFTLQYLGKFGPEERSIAVFTDGKNILNVQEGEVIQGKFIVSQIGIESVEIQFVDFPNWPPQRLPVGR